MQTVVALPPSETKDFYTVVHALAYDENDFVLRPLQWTRTAKPKSAAHDLIVVTRKSNGIEKAYPIDAHATGMFSFFDDMVTGVFGER
jgi:hypothetical protein